MGISRQATTWLPQVQLAAIPVAVVRTACSTPGSCWWNSGIIVPLSTLLGSLLLEEAERYVGIHQNILSESISWHLAHLPQHVCTGGVIQLSTISSSNLPCFFCSPFKTVARFLRGGYQPGMEWRGGVGGEITAARPLDLIVPAPLVIVEKR